MAPSHGLMQSMSVLIELMAWSFIISIGWISKKFSLVFRNCPFTMTYIYIVNQLKLQYLVGQNYLSG